jgi:transcriptional regulator with XRE-family HTH domain
MSKETVAAKLREARSLAGLSQAQVAHKLGLHRPSISEIEAARRNVTTEELKQLAELYGVTTAWIMSEESVGSSEKDLVLAARELGKIKEEDLERLMKVITMVRSSRR